MSLTQRKLAGLLFSPESVAIVGASADPTKTAGRPLSYLRAAGFSGRVYPVNPARDSVQGEKAWPTMDALPEIPDLAYVVTPESGVLAAVEDCARQGVPAVTILSSGFSESGPEGIEREKRVKAIAAETGMRIVGPSSLGIVNFRNGLFLTANAALAEQGLPVGRTLVLSQSGSMIGALASRGKARDIGFAALVSVGNEADLSIGEIAAATLHDPEIDSYLLFLETMRHAEALRAFAVEAARLGKPVVAYKIGRSQEAAELSLSHTGALAGEDDVADAFFADCGIARLDTLDGLLEAPALARAVARTGPGSSCRVGVITTTGGGAAMAVDRLASNGVEIASPDIETRQRLREAGAADGTGRIVDLTLAGTRYTVMKAALDVMLTAPEFDFVLVVVGSSARNHPELAVQPILDSARSEKPLAAFLVPDAPEAHRLLSRAGVPNFRSPESCADAIRAVTRCRAPTIGAQKQIRSAPAGRLCDEAQSYALLRRIGIEPAPFFEIDGNLKEISEFPFDYPVVVKLLSDEVPHKSDHGGVVLGVRDAAGVLAAVNSIKAAVGRAMPSLDANRFLVQRMTSGLGEALIGYRVDPHVGQLVMVAMGGVLAEIYRDRAIRLAPVTLETAREMIADVKGFEALAGYRGRKPADLEGLAHAIVAISGLADDPCIAEAEVNPLMLLENGVVAVDAVVRMSAPGID